MTEALKKVLEKRGLLHLLSILHDNKIITIIDLSLVRYNDLNMFGIQNVIDKVRLYDAICEAKKSNENKHLSDKITNKFNEISIYTKEENKTTTNNENRFLNDNKSVNKTNKIYVRPKDLQIKKLEEEVIKKLNQNETEATVNMLNEKIKQCNFSLDFLSLKSKLKSEENTQLQKNIESPIESNYSYKKCQTCKKYLNVCICMVQPFEALDCLVSKHNQNLISKNNFSKFNCLHNKKKSIKKRIRGNKNIYKKPLNFSLLLMLYNLDMNVSENEGKECVTSSKEDLKPEDLKQTSEIYKKHTVSEENFMTASQKKITVCIRKKPIEKNEKDVADCSKNSITIKELKKLDLSPFIQEHQFTFDKIFDENVKNKEIFDSIKNILTHVINGGNGSIIAYGQTGTGKTHSMFHPYNGVVFLTIEEWLKSKVNGFISFFEIYNGRAYDLLYYKEEIMMREKEGSVLLPNLTSKEFLNIEEGIQIIKEGMIIRKTGSTGANHESSRSHAILKIFTKENENNCLIFVDLAGSERGSDRKNVNDLVRHEGAEINKSLLALKECIRGMDNSSSHLPFRQSKLTQILKNSLIGNSMTCLIATINPSQKCVEHTLNTIRYANRIKELQNKRNNKNKEQDLNISKSNASELSKSHSTFMTDSYISNSYIKDKKFVFDSTFVKEESRQNLKKSLHAEINRNEKVQAVILSKKIENQLENIKENSKGIINTNALKLISDELKKVEKKIVDLKF